MDVHKPKPVHSWRELFKEIGIIVLGIVIALTGEQLVDSIHWKHKVADAETAMQRELSGDLAFSAAQMAMKDCANKYFARMETAVRGRRSDTLRQLADMDVPFTTHPWVEESWTAAISSEIPDHIARDKLGAYAILFRRVATQRERQFPIEDHYAEVMAGSAIDNPTPEIVYSQLAALKKLKADYGLTVVISDTMLREDAPRIGVLPDRKLVASYAAAPARCEKQLAAIPQ
jgi:hypothetical protein